jgi:hypothetical protein
MGRRLGASRKMPNLAGDAERLENKEWLLEYKTNDAANDPWSNDNIARNRERYIQNQQKFIDEHNRRRYKM